MVLRATAHRAVTRGVTLAVVALAVATAGDRDRCVRVGRILLCLRVRVRVLLGLRVLRDVLLLPVPATTRVAARVACGLRRSRILIRLALVRSVGVGLVDGLLVGRARTAVHVASGDADGNVGV